MAHCASEPFQESDKRVSSQVVGDNTAHTVRTRFMELMRKIPGLVQ